MQSRVILVVLFGVAGFLRFWNLGYSDYQGDEIKALYNPKEASSIKFFLDQRKGPMQFAVTAALKTFSPDYRNRFLLRLPFALAGFGSVVVFYFLAKTLFGEKIALYSTMFFATNGFFIAFSRIVQYQSLVIFFGLLAVYLIYRAVNKTPLSNASQAEGGQEIADSQEAGRVPVIKNGLLLAGFMCWALSILSHYDGVFFGPIIAGILLSAFVRQGNSQEKLRFVKSLITSTLVFVALNGLFYVPFTLNLSQSTTDYWAGRISGSVSGKISSTRYLFSVYQPIYVLHVYTILGVLGFFLAVVIFTYKLTSRWVAHRDARAPVIVDQLLKLTHLARSHQDYSTITLAALLLWFALPFAALEAVISIPGTHIYTYLIPVFLFLGFALFHVELLVQKIAVLFKNLFILRVSKAIFISLTLLLFGFLTLQSHYIFVDHTYEYPWENEKFVLWMLSKPVATYHLSLFGFPYYRHWDEIGDFIIADGKYDFYSTNERETISRFYIPLKKDGGKIGYYIHIIHPQTLVDDLNNKRVVRYTYYNEPTKVFVNGSRIVAKLYSLPVDGLPVNKEEFGKYGATESGD